MNEREQLTERIRSAMCLGWTEPSEIAERLIDDGVIVPPCKVGDMVYSLSGEGIFRQIVKFIETDKHSQIRLRCECDLDCNKCPHMGCWNEYRYRAYGLDDIGKTVFLTREEAEAALAERRKA